MAEKKKTRTEVDGQGSASELITVRSRATRAFLDVQIHDYGLRSEGSSQCPFDQSL